MAKIRSKMGRSEPLNVSKVAASRMVDLCVGPNIAMLAINEPENAEKLRDILIKCVLDMASKTEIRDPSSFTQVSMTTVLNLYNTYVIEKVTNWITNGVPTIIT